MSRLTLVILVLTAFVCLSLHFSEAKPHHCEDGTDKCHHNHDHEVKDGKESASGSDKSSDESKSDESKESDSKGHDHANHDHHNHEHHNHENHKQ